MQAKKFPMIWPQWIQGEAEWQIVDYESYAQEGFSENSIVYSAIMYKYRAINNAPLRAYTGTFDADTAINTRTRLNSFVLYSFDQCGFVCRCVQISRPA